MSRSLQDRHLVGAGAAACAVCCAAPLLTVFGIAGAAAAVATFIFAGLAFGLVVAAATLATVWRRRRMSRRCSSAPGPVQVELRLRHPDSSP